MASIGSKLPRAVYSLYLSLLTLLCIKFLFNWCPLGCHAVPCQDYFSGEPKPCFPQPINVARNRNISATNTCGMPKSSYCEIGPGKRCFVCDANSSATMHPARFMVDQESPFADNPTWWQSDTWWNTNQLGISKIGQPLHVNVTLSLGKSYHVSGKIRVQFYSERPQALVIERSQDNGKSWIPYQYFAKDCLATYGMTASEVVPSDDPLKVTCSEEYSGQFPTKNGIVEFQAYTRYLPEDYLEPKIQNYMKATHVKLRLEYPGTDGLELTNSEVNLNRYYYAISNIRVDGRCDCHGHAEFCDGVGMNQYCYCEHNTDGRDCEYCKPLYNNQPWKAGNKTNANECQKCNCNEHATACRYNSNLENGACIGCIHNTTGTHCDECIDRFYRNTSKAPNDTDVCLACDCFPVGIIDDGTCNKKATAEIPLGQCNCKPNVFGRRCDECIPGYWGFRLPPGGRCQDCECNVLGTLNSSKDCDQQTGACFCKPFVEGEKCAQCMDGYYSFPTVPELGCPKCPCDLGGAFKTCEKDSGRCVCRNNIEGERCIVPKSKYFYPNFDYLLFEAERQEGNVENHLQRHTTNDLFTGQGFTRLTPGSAIHFKNIRVNVTWKYYIVLRYSAERLSPDRNLTLSIAGINTRNEIVIPFSELYVGSGLAWTAEVAISLASEEGYEVVIAFEGVGNVDETILLLDSLVLKPYITTTREYKESQPETVATLLECFHNASALATKKHHTLQCPSLVFSHSAEMYDGALACGCDRKGTDQVNRCVPAGGQCSCYEGFGGRTCNYCLAGYYGFGDGGCKACQCVSAGVKSDICNISSGVCHCKSSALGARCDQCKSGTFNLDPQNPQGCQPCFGYGHGHQCTTARGFIASQISSNFTGSALDGWYLARNASAAHASGDGLEIDGNVTLVAPQKYLGVQLISYKKRILVKVIPKSILNASHDAMLVLLTGQGYQTLLKPNAQTLRNFTEFSFTIDKQPGSAITDFQFQSILSKLTSVQLMVRSNLILREVVMESAVYDPMSDVSAHVGFVENMSCFSNYTGLSCETCAPGFTRAIPNSGPFSECVPCSCNERASECDPESGVCINCDLGSAGDHCERCQFNVIGPHCNVCADHFYGLTGDDRDCKPCDCHLPGTQYGNTAGCNVTTGQCKCNQSLRTGGKRCNVCQENAWNRTDSGLNCEECPPCFGMVKVEVDKFRQNFSTLLSVLRSLQKLPVLSTSEAFAERIRRTAENVEELMKIAEALQINEDTVDAYMEKAFDTIGIFDGSRKIRSTAVNVSRNLTERRMGELNDIKMVFESTRDLVTSTYHVLSKTVKNQTDQLRNSLHLLRDWSTALYETEKQSKTKSDHIGRSKDSVNGDLETAVLLTTQATTDAIAIVAAFDLFLANVSGLQVRSSFTKELGRDTLRLARQRYHNASLVFNSTSQLDVVDPFVTSNISEVSWLNQSAEEDKKAASDVISTVQNLIKSSLDIVNETQHALKLVPLLQEQVRQFEDKSDAYYSDSRRYASNAVSAVTQAEELHKEAENTLTTVRDFSNSVEKAKERSDLSRNDVAEISSFHRSKILFAKNVSASVQSSFNLSGTLVQLSKTVEEHAMQELKAITDVFALSEKLKNDTTNQQGVIKKAAVVDHIDAMVDPVREKCSYVRRQATETLINSSTTGATAAQLLDKVKPVSRKLDETIKDFRAMPSINTKPLASMKSDIARNGAAFKTLKLAISLERLREGKTTQETWLALHKPKVIKLRSDVTHLQELLASLRNVRCDVNE